MKVETVAPQQKPDVRITLTGEEALHLSEWLQAGSRSWPVTSLSTKPMVEQASAFRKALYVVVSGE